MGINDTIKHTICVNIFPGICFVAYVDITLTIYRIHNIIYTPDDTGCGIGWLFLNKW